jgi:hypothetical protein
LKLATPGAVNPAPFVHDPPTDALFESGPEYTEGAEQEEMPEIGSLPLNATLTGCVYQPFVVGGPTRSPVTAGGVVSILTDTLFVAVSPSAFVAEHVTTVPAVSAPSVTGSHPAVEATADSASATVQLTDTALVYQPLAPEVPATVGAIVGGVTSAPSSVTADETDEQTSATAARAGTSVKRLTTGPSR